MRFSLVVGLALLGIASLAQCMQVTDGIEVDVAYQPAATPAAIRHGAEDGGEMGAFHGDYLSLLAEAVVDKLQEYLPVGLQAVVIPDTRLLDMPG